MTEYNLKEKVHNRYIVVIVGDGMYGLPQSVRIAQDDLSQQLETYVQHTRKTTPWLCTHDSLSINFTLVVEIFGA